MYKALFYTTDESLRIRLERKETALRWSLKSCVFSLELHTFVPKI